MYKNIKGYSKSFIKPSSPIDAISTPNGNKVSSFVSNTHSAHPSKLHKPSYDLTSRQGITVAEFTTQPTQGYSIKTISKAQLTNPKSPMNAKPQGKDSFAQNTKDMKNKETIKKPTYAVLQSKKNEHAHDSSHSQLFEPFPATKHSKRWSDYSGNLNHYQIEKPSGVIAERMTPDRCSKNDLTLEECRSTFSTFETQETLETEVMLKQDNSISLKRKPMNKQSVTASNRFSLKNQNESKKILIEDKENQKRFVNRDLAWDTKQENVFVKNKRESLPLEKIRTSSEEPFQKFQQKINSIEIKEIKDTKLVCINHNTKKVNSKSI